MGLFSSVANTVNQVVSRRARRKPIAGNSIAKRAANRFHCEALEPRLLMTCTCGGDFMDNPATAAAMMAEEMAITNLVMPDMASKVAVQSGNWSSPNTWQGGVVPNAGANVLIPEGVSVTFNAASTPALHWLRVDGTLQFSTSINTNLLVDTVVVSCTGHWIMGTASDPIHQGVHATVTFADTGAINTVWDPLQFSRGFIALGSVDIHGLETTAYEALASSPHQGDTILNLAGIPINWNVGDSIILTGTNPSAAEDETLQILAISGNQVTVSPLAFDHIAPVGASVYVTDVTRNVVFQSQNSTNISRRGHFMIMHSEAVDVEYAAYVGLGRTDKSRLIDDVVNINFGGAQTPGGATNVRGRYAFHIHHGGICMEEAPATVVGNVVLGSPGWGFVNHASYVNFLNNVTYNVTGAGFVAEAGNEVGSFVGNLAIRATGSSNTTGREERQDWGYRGNGFSFESPGVEVVNNIAVGTAGAGFAYTPIGLFEAGMGRTAFLAENLVDPSIAGGANTMAVPDVPLRMFDGNQAFACDIGVDVYGHMLHVTHKVRSLLQNTLVWGVGSQGMRLDYSAHITLNNVRVMGNFTKLIQQGISINNLAEDFVFNNVRVEGFLVGLQVAAFGSTTVTGGYFNNLRNIDIMNARENPTTHKVDRVVNISNVQFGVLPNPIAAAAQVNIYVRLFYPGLGLVSFLKDQGIARYNGQYLYALEQDANYVPFPTTQVWSGVPAQLLGKTNQQLMDEFGLCAGGMIAPRKAVTKTGIRGLVGSYVAPLPTLTLMSPQVTSVLTNYSLTYKDWLGNTTTTQVNLSLGWNIITLTIGGRKRSFLIFGQ